MKFDYVLVGGGLQNALLSLALLQRSDRPSVAIVERGATLGGNHLWSFHAGDVRDGARAFVEPLIEHRWAGYDVAFPDASRAIDEPYASVTSASVDRVVRAAIASSIGSVVRSSREACEVSSRSVVLDDGEVLEADVVVDARGPERVLCKGRVGFQKFVGVELALARPHARSRPLLIDARVPQVDGFRFVYTLPLEPRLVLVEDTYYSDTPHLDVGTLTARALSYAADQGLDVAEVARVETGVLPLPLDDMPAPSTEGIVRGGYAGGWFHPTTGYSFPAAVRLASHLASVPADELYGVGYRAMVAEHDRQARFALLLNRLLFSAMPPLERWRVLQRFHQLPAETIRRFYAMTTTAADRARIVCGRPPQGISLRAALRAVTA
jgi:lycopene beta-cyclase